jgi:hypothetical protein
MVAFALDNAGLESSFHRSALELPFYSGKGQESY